jgi:hypothetical protein
MLGITEKKLEAQLRQSQKMDAIGQLAAGVAHINNLLTIIHAMPVYRWATSEQMHRSLSRSNSPRTGRRATRQLLAFSRKQVMHSARTA